MKDDELYQYYIKYLENRLIEGKLSRGSYSLLSISENSFNDFKYKYQNNKAFSISLLRDKKIDDIFDDKN